jgi:hypothetical protein
MTFSDTEIATRDELITVTSRTVIQVLCNVRHCKLPLLLQFLSYSYLQSTYQP